MQLEENTSEVVIINTTTTLKINLRNINYILFTKKQLLVQKERERVCVCVCH